MRAQVTILLTIMSVGLTAFLAGCGNVMLTNNFSVKFDDPAGALGSQPIKVSVFDPAAGPPVELAAQSMGSTTSQAPYSTSFTTSASRLIGDDNPAPTMDVGIELPQLTKDGYFTLTLSPRQTASSSETATFVPYPSATNPANQPGLPVDVTATQIDQGWNIELTVDVPTTYQVPKPSASR